MPITKRKCRVCGKEYEACRTPKTAVGGFNWREVACSPECGERYLRAVMEARGIVPSTTAEEPAYTGKKAKNKHGKRHERPELVEEHTVAIDAVGDEAPAVSGDTADDIVPDEAVGDGDITDADFE